MKRKLLSMMLLCSLFVNSAAWAATQYTCSQAAAIKVLGMSPATGATAQLVQITIYNGDNLPYPCGYQGTQWTPISATALFGTSGICPYGRAYIELTDLELFEYALSASLQGGHQFSIAIFDGQAAKGGPVHGNWACKLLSIY